MCVLPGETILALSGEAKIARRLAQQVRVNARVKVDANVNVNVKAKVALDRKR
jgi:hypothetical protein